MSPQNKSSANKLEYIPFVQERDSMGRLLDSEHGLPNPKLGGSSSLKAYKKPPLPKKVKANIDMNKRVIQSKDLKKLQIGISRAKR